MTIEPETTKFPGALTFKLFDLFEEGNLPMAVQVLIGNQKGPLPIQATFMAPGDMPMNLEVTGSVWTQTANQMIGIQIAIDGNVVGTANIFSNANATHRAVVPVYIPIKLDQGSHTIALSAASGTVSDSNDFYTAVLHY